MGLHFLKKKKIYSYVKKNIEGTNYKCGLNTFTATLLTT